MVNLPGRNGRRRRMLNEEVLAASGALAGRHRVVSDESAADAPRYSDAAGVEHHPQITDFVPRKYRTIGMLVTGGVATVALLGVLHYFAPVVAAIGLPSLRPFDVSAPGSIAAWVGAVVLFIAAVTCLVVYSLRRHRIDDFRGRYRVWRSASVVCLLLSVNCVAGLHDVLAKSMSHFVGWTALRDGAVWWLAVAGVPMAWVGLRVLIDVRECRLSAVFACAAAALYAVAAGSYFGFVPTGEAENASLLTGAAMVLGHWMALASVVTYARFVVLDVQGLIPVRRASAQQKRKRDVSDASHDEATDEPKPTVLNVAEYARKRAARGEDPEDAKRWVDGSRPERDSFDDDEEVDGGSKMNKSDRKRMRKLKSQKRAA